MHRRNTTILSASQRLTSDVDPTYPQSVLGMTYGYEPKNPYLQEIKSYSRNTPLQRSLRARQSASRMAGNFGTSFESDRYGKSPTTKTLNTNNLNHLYHRGNHAQSGDSGQSMTTAQLPRRRTLADESELQRFWPGDSSRNAQEKRKNQLHHIGTLTNGHGHANELDSDEYEYSLEPAIRAYDVEVQVQPKIRDKSTQSDAEFLSPVPSPKIDTEHEDVLEENFRMRRLVEELRFRLAETTHEMESLQDQLTTAHFLPPETITQSPKTSSTTHNQESQTEPLLLNSLHQTSVSSASLTSIHSNHHGDFEEDSVSPLPPSLPSAARGERTSRTISYQNLRELSDDTEPISMMTAQGSLDRRRSSVPLKVVPGASYSKGGDSFRGIVRGHLRRIVLLEECDQGRTVQAQKIVQTAFRSYLQRRQFLDGINVN